MFNSEKIIIWVLVIFLFCWIVGTMTYAYKLFPPSPKTLRLQRIEDTYHRILVYSNGNVVGDYITAEYSHTYGGDSIYFHDTSKDGKIHVSGHFKVIDFPKQDLEKQELNRTKKALGK